MKKTIYSVRATFEIEVDPSKPESLTAAATWVKDLQAGKVVDTDELNVKVTAETPKIRNTRG